jgi:hypothetical protein
MTCVVCGAAIQPSAMICVQCGAQQPSAHAQFQKVEREAARLRSDFNEHRLNREQFLAAMGRLKINFGGRYWMVGAQSGSWYAHDGRTWVRSPLPEPAPSSSQHIGKPGLLRLRLSSGRSLGLLDGARLNARELVGLGDDAFGGAFAEVSANPSDPTAIGLKNLGRGPWPTTTAQGEQRTVDPGRSIRLAHGLRIAFGPVAGTVQQNGQGFALHLDNLHPIALIQGTKITAADLLAMTGKQATDPAAEVVHNPGDARVFGLKNLSGLAWSAIMPEGQRRRIDPGKSIRLVPGTSVDFGVAKGDISSDGPTLH